jgi:lysophospholipase L1-like esterase
MQVAMTELDPLPFLRGNVFEPCDGAPYPRAAPADQFRLPAATWQAAMVPVGVRLELSGDATGVVIRYTTAASDVIRGERARTFESWSPHEKIDAVTAGVGEGEAELRLALGSGPATIYIPEAMRPTIHFLRPVGGALVPARPRPRWVAYGDSILEGWVASAAALAWPARVARAAGLDLVNLGYAGAARGEIATAESVAALEATVVTLSYGTNCWATIPHSDAMLSAGFEGFLTIVRQGHPATPVIVMSPIRRPSAEMTPNRLGATLQSLRGAMEEVVRSRIAAGDRNLVLIEGHGLVPEDHLPDGVHPDDEGHRLLAEAAGSIIAGAIERTTAPM